MHPRQPTDTTRLLNVVAPLPPAPSLVQDTTVDRARHLLALASSCTFGGLLINTHFSTVSLAVTHAVLAFARLYPLLHAVVGAVTSFVGYWLFHRGLDSFVNDVWNTQGLYQIGCVVPDYIRGRSAGTTPVCRENQFLWVLVGVSGGAMALLLLMEVVATLALRKLRLADERSLCFFLVPRAALRDVINDIVDVDVEVIADWRQAGINVDGDDAGPHAAVVWHARNLGLSTLRINVHNELFRLKYFTPWATYVLIFVLLPAALLTLTWVEQFVSLWDGVNGQYPLAIGLGLWTVRGAVELLRFLRWVFFVVFQ